MILKNKSKIFENLLINTLRIFVEIFTFVKIIRKTESRWRFDSYIKLYYILDSYIKLIHYIVTVLYFCVLCIHKNPWSTY